MSLFPLLLLLGLAIQVDGRGGGRVSSGRSSSSSAGRSSSGSSSGYSSGSSSGSYGSGSRSSSSGSSSRSYSSGSSSRSYGSSSYGTGSSSYGSRSVLNPAISSGTAFGGGSSSWGARGYQSKPSGSQGVGKAALAVGGLGLGIGIGTLGTGAVLASYQEYRELREGRGLEWGCEGGCAGGTTCTAGLCVCPEGQLGVRGQCLAKEQQKAAIQSLATGEKEAEVFHSCSSHADCQARDFNLVCANTSTASTTASSTASTTAKTTRLCQCRQATQWNSKAAECQLSLAVNCSLLLPNKPMSPRLQAAADKSRSSPGLLAELDPDTATAEELAEAFCRDIHPESFPEVNKKEKKVEKTEAGPGWKLWPASTILLITAVVAFHLMLMACICFGIKKTCWVCRKSAGRVQKGWKQEQELKQDPAEKQKDKEKDIEEQEPETKPDVPGCIFPYF